jgi:hypothetical protein
VSSQSLKSFSALLHVDPAILVDLACSSNDKDCSLLTDDNGQVETSFMKSYRRRINGLNGLQKNVYKNLSTSTWEDVLQVRTTFCPAFRIQAANQKNMAQ